MGYTSDVAFSSLEYEYDKPNTLEKILCPK